MRRGPAGARVFAETTVLGALLVKVVRLGSLVMEKRFVGASVKINQ